MILEMEPPKNDDFLEITKEEMALITQIRDNLLKAYNGEVLGDIVSVSPDELVVVIDIKAIDKQDVITINRKTLKWTL